jgi:leucyl aminopeptidase
MMIQLLRQAAAEVQASWLVLPLFEDLEPTPVVTRDTALAGLLARLVERKEVTGSLGELTALHGIPGFAAESLLLVGLGLRAKFGAGSAFAAGFALAKRLSGKARDHVAVVIPEGADFDPPEFLSALVEGAVAGTRGPGLRKTEPTRYEFGVLSFVIAPDGTEDRLREIQDQLRRGEIVGQAINLARDLVNTPPSDKAPAHLAEQIRGVADEAGLSVQVWDEARIRDAKFGGLLGVAAGSENPPAFVVLQYTRAGEASPIALVGKGVTFDSGGLSLKPSASMEDMKSDMTGAAVVVAAMQAAARLQLPVNITGYLDRLFAVESPRS